MSSSRRTKRFANRNFLTRLLLICGAAYLMAGAELALAAIPTATGFTTNFNPNDISSSISWSATTVGYCNPAEGGNCLSNFGDGDPTPMGVYIVTIGGVAYYHTLVGDPATGFAIESYTRAATTAGINLNTGIFSSGGGAFSPDSGGNERASMTNTTIGNTAAANNIPFFQSSMNTSNSLGDYNVSGTGSGDPSKTIFRMVLSDPAGGMSMEVYKPFLDKKPRISETVTDGTMTSVFVTDQTTLGYSDSSTAAPVVNNVVINDPQLPTAGAADFEMALAQTPDVTSGRYIYTPGTGWVDPVNGWDQALNPTTGTFDPNSSSFGEGHYSYVDGAGFDPLNFDWSTVFDYTQNATACSTPGQNGFYRDGFGVYGGSCFNKP